MDLRSRFGVSILLMFYICKLSYAQGQTFNIMQYGAVADGKTDNSKALSTAWSQACGGGGVVIIPQGTFLVLPLILEGPCNASVQLQIEGVLQASSDQSYAIGDHWLIIRHVSNLMVNGGGTLDGQGASAWPYSGCKHNETCAALSVTLRFDAINTATVTNIRSINSKMAHFSVSDSQTVTFDNVSLIAPGDSPNTDGIDITRSTNINVINSIITTGDDCIALGAGSKVINITSVQCGPGHGISIGSLGRSQNEDDVSDITVQQSTFSGTQNGVRIKTWSTPYASLVSNVRFMHLQMNNVNNPIIIDQSYCPHEGCPQKSQSRVQIQDVKYEDIRGTSMSKVAVKFDCSEVLPCHGIVLQDINLAFNGGEPTNSSCLNAQGSASGQEFPPSCLQSSS